ncbi:MAG: hypothetical protein J5621_09315 [Paludibacteraceae bacterium]|nr:hypothetical protein [Paludibacteraceae bacterium]
MESGMTLSDYMTLEKVGNRNKGVANTALGLGIGLGAAALVGVVAVGWGLNSASKARSRAAENLSAAYAVRQNDLLSLIASERASRETWQTRNQPSIGQYVDVQTNPNLNAQLQDYVTAMATATATANANSPLNAAIGTDSFLKVQRYSAPQPCGCDSCNG